MAPIPEAIFFVNLSIWLLQLSLSLMSILWESVRVPSLCLDPISINSVLVIFRVSLFAISQLLTFAKSLFKHDWILSALSPRYVRWVSSAYILGWQFDKQFGGQFGKSLIYSRNNKGPKMVPWETPQLNEQLLESDSLRPRVTNRSWINL